MKAEKQQRQCIKSEWRACENLRMSRLTSEYSSTSCGSSTYLQHVIVRCSGLSYQAPCITDWTTRGSIGTNEVVSGSKIEPLSAELKENVSHDEGISGSVGTDHDIDQSKIPPLSPVNSHGMSVHFVGIPLSRRGAMSWSCDKVSSSAGVSNPEHGHGEHIESPFECRSSMFFRQSPRHAALQCNSRPC